MAVSVRLPLIRNAISVDANFHRLVKHGNQVDFPRPRRVRSSITRANSENARLSGVPTRPLTTYELDFSVDLASALQKNATSVKVALFRDRSPGGDVARTDSAVDSSRNQVKKAAQVRFARLERLSDGKLAERTVDITSAVNNETFSALVAPPDSSDPRAREPDFDRLSIVRRRLIRRSVRDVRLSGATAPILESSVVDAGRPRQSRGPRRESAHAVLMSGRDPSDITTLDIGMDQNDVFAGVMSDADSMPSRREGDALRSHFFSFINSDTRVRSTATMSDEAQVPVLAKTVDPRANFTVALELNTSDIPSSLKARFELSNNNGVVLASLTRRIDHARNVKLFNTPTVPPQVTVSCRPAHSPVGRGKLTIRQRDPKARSVVIFKRTIPSSQQPMLSSYTRIADMPLTIEDGEKSFPIDIDTINTLVFRCVPAGSLGELSSVYKNVVIPTKNLATMNVTPRFTHASVIARIAAGGVSIELNSLPSDAKALRIERRDLTLHERKFVTVSGMSGVILINENTMQPVLYFDDTVKQDHVYEYRCLLQDRFGSDVPGSDTAIIKYIPLVENVVTTNITNTVIGGSESDLDFTFDVLTEVVPTGLERVKSLLDSRDLQDFFGDDLKVERNKLGEIIAHRILRTDTTTGEVSDFGIITSETFSDRTLRENRTIQPLQRGHSYRYEVFALLRNPETMLDDFTKTVTVEGKTHTFKPSKFLHPLALKQGIITTASTRAVNHAEDEFSFGRVGNVAVTEVSFMSEENTITDVSIERIDNESIVLRWKVPASPDVYDHFLVFRESLDRRRFVAAVHNIKQGNTYEFIHRFDSDDIGRFQFFIMPILNDYSVGVEAPTDFVLMS